MAKQKTRRSCISSREAKQAIKRIDEVLTSSTAAISIITLENWREQLEEIITARRS